MTKDDEILEALRSIRDSLELMVANQNRAMTAQEQALANQMRAIETQESSQRFAKRIALVGLLLVIVLIAGGALLESAQHSN